MISRVYSISFKQSLLDKMAQQSKTVPKNKTIVITKDEKKQSQNTMPKHKKKILIAGILSIGIILANIVQIRRTDPIRQQKKLIKNLVNKINNTSNLNDISDEMLKHLNSDNSEAKHIVLNAVVDNYPKGLSKDIKKAVIKYLSLPNSEKDLERMSKFLSSIVKIKELDNEMIQKIIESHKNMPESSRLNTVQFMMSIKNANYEQKDLNRFWELVNDVKTKSFKHFDSNLEAKIIDTTMLKTNIASKIIDSKKSDVDYLFELQSFLDNSKLDDIGKLNLIEHVYENKIKDLYFSITSPLKKTMIKLLLEKIFKINKADYQNFKSLKQTSSFELGSKIYEELLCEKIPNKERLGLIDSLIEMYKQSKSKPSDLAYKINSLNRKRLQLKNNIFLEENIHPNYQTLKKHIEHMLIEFENAKNNMAYSIIHFYNDKTELKKIYEEFYKSIETKINNNFDISITNLIKEKLKTFGKKMFNIDFQENHNSYNQHWSNNNYKSGFNKKPVNTEPVKKACTTFIQYLTFISDVSQDLKEIDISKADEKTLKILYRKLAIKYHPDKAPENKKAEYSKIFQEITNAYEVLKKSII